MLASLSNEKKYCFVTEKISLKIKASGNCTALGRSKIDGGLLGRGYYRLSLTDDMIGG